MSGESKETDIPWDIKTDGSDFDRTEHLFLLSTKFRILGMTQPSVNWYKVYSP